MARFSAESSGLRGETKHDVKARGQLTDLRAGDRRKIHRYRLPRPRVAYRAVKAVVLIAGMPLDVEFESSKVRGPWP